MTYSEDDSDNEQKKSMFVSNNRIVEVMLSIFLFRIRILMRICINLFGKILAKLEQKVLEKTFSSEIASSISF